MPQTIPEHVTLSGTEVIKLGFEHRAQKSFFFVSLQENETSVVMY
jgi:hypothetical protein